MQDDGLTPKQRYHKKKYEEAPFINCACGCGEVMKSVDRHGRVAKFVNGHNTRRYTGTAATRAAAQKRWVKSNPEKVRDAKRERHRALKIKLMEAMGNRCWFCTVEYNGKNGAIFDFHHRDPDEKEISMSRIIGNWSWTRVLAEASRCVLVCGNCHSQHHGGEW
jgi:hypothetical protein